MRMTAWPFLVPLAGLGVLGVTLLVQPGATLLLLSGAALLGSVVSAVHHAEVVAHRVGEPFGTLILALAVTIIEAALVLSMMLEGGEFSATVARDAIYSAVMIICNGVVGLCLLVGGLRHVEQAFRIEGTGSGLAALELCARWCWWSQPSRSVHRMAHIRPLSSVSLRSRPWRYGSSSSLYRRFDIETPFSQPNRQRTGPFLFRRRAFARRGEALLCCWLHSSELWVSRRCCRRASSEP